MANFFVLGIDNIRHLHEREAAIRLVRLLRDTIPKHDVYLCFAVHVGAEIDCLLLTASGAVIGEFKEWPYGVTGRMNGPWFRQRGRDGIDIVLGDATPYEQAQKQRSRLSRLLEAETARLSAHAPTNWSRFVDAGLVQCPRLRLDFEALNSPWWFQCGLEDFSLRLSRSIEATGEIDTDFFARVLRKLGVVTGQAIPTREDVLSGEPSTRTHTSPHEQPTEGLSLPTRAPSIARSGRHSLILAGAGAGKTQHMASLVARTLSQDLLARAYAISYTNRARDVLRERVLALVSDEAARERVQFGTIHQFAQSLSRPFIGAKRVATHTSCVEYLKRAFPSLPVDALAIHQMHQAVCSSDGEHIAWKEPWHESAWRSLQQHLGKKHQTTFEGLLIDGLSACAQADIKFSHVFVDEFQDTNGLQFAMLTKLAERGAILTVVGDAEQSIYGFAGALPKALERFQSQHGPQREVLEVNHRSAERIVGFANALRADGCSQRASRTIDGRVRVHARRSPREIAATVAAEIAEQVSEASAIGRASADFAVLARTQAELKVFESELAVRGVPVQSRDARPFHETRHVPKLLALLHGLDMPDDPDAIALALTAIGQQSAARELLTTAEETQSASVTTVVTLLAAEARTAIEALKQRLADAAPPGSAIATQVESLHKLFVLPALGIFDRTATRLDLFQGDVDAIIALAEYAAISPGALARMIEEDQAISLTVQDGVRLATVHEAKGDEWTCVYIANIGSSSFPHPVATDYAEEKRLLYVACTRAADELVLCHGDGLPVSPFLPEAIRDR